LAAHKAIAARKPDDAKRRMQVHLVAARELFETQKVPRSSMTPRNPDNPVRTVL
jgi:hypothetical protein